MVKSRAISFMWNKNMYRVVLKCSKHEQMETHIFAFIIAVSPQQFHFSQNQPFLFCSLFFVEIKQWKSYDELQMENGSVNIKTYIRVHICTNDYNLSAALSNSAHFALIVIWSARRLSLLRIRCVVYIQFSCLQSSTLLLARVCVW